MDIYPSFPLDNEDLSSDCFVKSVGYLLEQILPPEVLAVKDDPELFYATLNPFLPYVSWCQLIKNSSTFRLALISRGEYTHGTGRFVSDCISRRLIPGKIIEIVGTRTFSFLFFRNGKEYLINERWFTVETEELRQLVRENFPRLSEEMRLSLSTVCKIRRFLSITQDYKKELPSFLNSLSHFSTLEEMHAIVQKLAGEQTLKTIRNYINEFPKQQLRLKIFDKDLFSQITPFLSIYGEKFLGDRPLKWVARMLCFHVYFQSKLKEDSVEKPFSRTLFIKFFRSPKILGILIGLNLLDDNEVLKKQHLLEAINNISSHFKEVEGSFFLDNSSPMHPILYIEVTSTNGSSFSSEEIHLLRTRLVVELQDCIQRVFNPLFVLRNDEDYMRHLILLSKELQYSRDLPQVMISFEEQTNNELSFSVVFLRVLKKELQPLSSLIEKLKFKTSIREIKTLGWVRNKYPKEAAIFKVSMPKILFLRKNHALDLPKARTELVKELIHIFGEVRDYNGGLLSKQLDILREVKILLGDKVKPFQFLLENFFFSLEPLNAQTRISPFLLKRGFSLLLQMHPLEKEQIIDTLKEGVCALFRVSSTESKSRYIAFIEALQKEFTEICYSFIHIQNLYALCIFFTNREKKKKEAFLKFLRGFSLPFSIQLQESAAT